MLLHTLLCGNVSGVSPVVDSRTDRRLCANLHPRFQDTVEACGGFAWLLFPWCSSMQWLHKEQSARPSGPGERADPCVPQPYLSTRSQLSRRREEEGAWRAQSSSQGPGMSCLAKPLSLLDSQNHAAEGSYVLTRGYL